jgi:ABC-type amino acid transport system permease subunit
MYLFHLFIQFVVVVVVVVVVLVQCVDIKCLGIRACFCFFHNDAGTTIKNKLKK